MASRRGQRAWLLLLPWRVWGLVCAWLLLLSWRVWGLVCAWLLLLPWRVSGLVCAWLLLLHFSVEPQRARESGRAPAGARECGPLTL